MYHKVIHRIRYMNVSLHLIQLILLYYCKDKNSFLSLNMTVLYDQWSMITVY